MFRFLWFLLVLLIVLARIDQAWHNHSQESLTVSFTVCAHAAHHPSPVHPVTQSPTYCSVCGVMKTSANKMNTSSCQKQHIVNTYVNMAPHGEELSHSESGPGSFRGSSVESKRSCRVYLSRQSPKQQQLSLRTSIFFYKNPILSWGLVYAH